MKTPINISPIKSTFGDKYISGNKKGSINFFLCMIALAFVLLFAGCKDNGTSSEEEPQLLDPTAAYSFDGPVFDISATGNGSILVADFGVIKEIDADGTTEITDLPLVDGTDAFGEPGVTFINGLLPLGNGSFYASRSGLDLAVGAGLLFYDGNNTELTSDIEAFTIGDWPEGEPGQALSWKSFNCEPPGGYTVGPQSNPYHLAPITDNEMLLTDAAGNSLLRIATNGNIEVVATFTPIVSPETGEQLIQFPLDEETNCFVEPVPTGLAIGPDGAYYVGELVGSTPQNFSGEPSPDGLASIWRIEAGSRNVVCPSDDCSKVVTGLNTVIDLEFSPDNQLYVVEFERNGFLAAVAPDLGIPVAGGTVKRCDITANSCEIIAGANGDLMLPGGITFDGDNLWLLDNVFSPTIRSIQTQ